MAEGIPPVAGTADFPRMEVSVGMLAAAMLLVGCVPVLDSHPVRLARVRLSIHHYPHAASTVPASACESEPAASGIIALAAAVAWVTDILGMADSILTGGGILARR